METIQLLPKASSLIESLRDIGYSFESAIADIIDNSITAKAKNIKIYFKFEHSNLQLAIVDDGHGMSKQELIEAMRTGGKNPLDKRDSGDLGRFGLGLKTASFSQCRKLTVVSSKNNQISGAIWDLDYVASQDDWSLKIANDLEMKQFYAFNRLVGDGTLVIWENADRILDNTISETTEDIIYEKIENLQKHLELVFHRYLSGRDKINIFINENLLQAFDPFNSKHQATQELPEEIITINTTKIHIKPFILPHYTKVSVEDYEYYSGIGGYLKNQGFYVYRNKRLLISGTWFRIIPQTEMYKLARIQIDLPNNLDHLWKIDVKKSDASPPAIIKQRLRKIVDKIAGTSTKVYRSRGIRELSSNVTFWKVAAARGEIKYIINKDHPLIDAFINKINTERKHELFEILNLIGNFFPKDTLYSDLSNRPKEVNFNNFMEDDELEKKALFLYENALLTIDNIESLKYTEPFNKYTKNWKDFFLKIPKGEKN